MCILHCRTNHSTSYMYMYICTAVLFSVVSCRVLCQLLWTVPAAAVSATGTLPASTKQIDCRNSYDCCTFPGTLYQLYQLLYMYSTGTCTQSSFDKSSFDKTVPAADQQMSATVQRMSAGVQRMSATVQRMSANFQNKAVSKYFWNMYQLMSAAVHVLRYVLSSGYQMRALHEFTNVSGS